MSTTFNQVKVTAFAKLVYEATKKIPEGKVSTYKLIAEAIGRPKSYRAVGHALSTNPFSALTTHPTLPIDEDRIGPIDKNIMVPCHRVIKSNGEIGGFFGSKEEKYTYTKRELLIVEGIVIKNGVLDKTPGYLEKILFNPKS